MSLPPPRKFRSAAEEINLLHSEILHLIGVRALEKAIRIGELLTQEKAKHPGRWLDWIKNNLRVSRDTTANYMRVYERRDQLKCKANLTFTDAVKLLAESVPTAGGSLKSRFKSDQRVRPSGKQETSSSEEERWKRHEEEAEDILLKISTVEGRLRSAQGFDDPLWNQVDFDAVLGHVKEIRKLLLVPRQFVRSKLPPPPKPKPA